MLVRFNKRTIVGGTIYTPESGEVELANDIADQVVAAGNGVVVGFGAYSNEATLATDASGNTVLVGPSGAIETISVNIIPRRDTLVNLLDDTAGGVGEISEATDWDALVLHNGVVGGAKVLYCNPKSVQVIAFVPQSIATGTTPAPLSYFQAVTGFENTTIWGSGAPTVFNVPTGANRVRVAANVGFAANATGTRNLTVTDQVGNSVIHISQAVAHPTGATYLDANGIAVLAGTETSLRVAAWQNSGVALNTEPTPFTRATVEFWVA